MKIISLMNAAELRTELKKALLLLALARCPDDECIRGHVMGRLAENDSRCQWCTEKSELAEVE